MVYTLKQGKLQAKADSRGAQLISLTDGGGTEYIWQRREPYWQKCTPVLFPVVGRCRDEVIAVDGKAYPMPEVHGFASNMEFELTKQTEDAVCFRLTDSRITREKYPFSFVLEVKHTLSDTGVHTEFTVFNPDDKDMVFGIGGHPGISCPLAERESFEDYVLDFGKTVTLDSICISDGGEILPQKRKRILAQKQMLPLSRSLFEPDALIFEKPPFDSLLLKSKKSGRGVRFSFENFSAFAVWTECPPKQAPFICLEPWNGMGRRTGEGTELSEKAGVITLNGGGKFSCGYRIEPLSDF